MTEKQMKITTRIIMLVNSFAGPFVLMLLWNWFVVKIGAPHITYWLAFGLDVTIGFVFSGDTKKNEKVITNDAEYMFLLSIYSASNIIVALVLGYVVHLFV